MWSIYIWLKSLACDHIYTCTKLGSLYQLKYIRDSCQLCCPLDGFLLERLDVSGHEHGSQLHLSMLQLLQEGVGVVYIQQDRAVGFVLLEVKILLTPFLLDGEELLFQL